MSSSLRSDAARAASWRGWIVVGVFVLGMVIAALAFAIVGTLFGIVWGALSFALLGAAAGAAFIYAAVRLSAPTPTHQETRDA
ncbi:MAG: hypothetical protein NW200_00070 [Hyphomonadaceae bacterium]|nr:hypothetical protein [Hyphomonadaceae bacterium]